MTDTNNKPSEAPKPPEPTDQLSITQHTVRIDGHEIAYTVTAGTVVLRRETEKDGAAEGEKAKATVFFVAYTRDNVGDLGSRPITFSFNGGPGSSSVWLHLGTLGPRRVRSGDAGQVAPPPYQLLENEFSILDHTDLVFIDPVSTGFSRAVSGEKPKDFHGFQSDLESVGDFIRLYVARQKRWLSPKFLIGESYGTTRAAGLSGYLQERHGMYLNGLMLVSSVLDFGTLRFDVGNDQPYILFLPTYTATAWYHGKLEPALQQQPVSEVVRQAEEFARGEYASALMLGTKLEGSARKKLARKLSRFTGLSPEYIERCNLRLEIFRFTKELLRADGRTVGRLDSRFTGIDRDHAGERFEFDPAHAAITGPYTAAINHYVRADLKFESDLPYEVLNYKVWPWSYKEFENRYLNVAETMRKAISMNPALQVFVASGYYDLATPHMAADYVLEHLGLDAGLQGNIRVAYYEAGHMMYVHEPSLAKLKADLAAFITSSVSGSTTSSTGQG